MRGAKTGSGSFLGILLDCSVTFYPIVLLGSGLVRLESFSAYRYGVLTDFLIFMLGFHVFLWFIGEIGPFTYKGLRAQVARAVLADRPKIYVFDEGYLSQLRVPRKHRCKIINDFLSRGLLDESPEGFWPNFGADEWGEVAWPCKALFILHGKPVPRQFLRAILLIVAGLIGWFYEEIFEFLSSHGY